MNLLSTPAKLPWARIGISSKHGINLPLSALHTAQSCGIGEFLDLLPLIEWCKEVGLQIIQLLPLNNSGYDPSPYNTLSSCALHPVFLSLHALPYLENYPELIQELAPLRLLNQTDRISYKEVLEKKMSFLHHYVSKIAEKVKQDPSFQAFSEQFPWIRIYGLFRSLKDHFQEENWQKWPGNISSPSLETISLLLSEHQEEVLFYEILQYLCVLQLSKVKKYAKAHGILLKGDLPILISPDSADVWSDPQLFNTTLSAGAPPDNYSAEGQYWGFPIIRWEVLKETDFKWWQDRVRFASQFYDLFRLDHVVGLFRIWAIPLNRPSREGKFLPEDSSLWLPHGKEILEKILQTTLMLPIAEDLGSVSDEVRSQLSELGICGTKVMRWERAWQKGGAFIPYTEYPKLSMTTVSTHDSETLALWWRDSSEEAKAFAAFKQWPYTPELTTDQRREILWESHHTPSLFHINLLQEYLALVPHLTRTNIADERINIPGKILATNWTYRFLPSVEEIIQNQQLKEEMRKVLQ